MLQYVNSFTCTKNEHSNTVVIHFTQNEPIINETENGLETVVRENEVSSLVMEGPCAQGLLDSLREFFENNADDMES